MRLRILLLTSILALNIFSLQAQGVFLRPIISLQYDFFSPQYDILRTSPRALGSGIYDFSQKIGLSHILNKKASQWHLGIDFPVINIEKFRFANNILFTGTSIITDLDTTHYYPGGFFSSYGSKLTLISLFTPVYLVYKIPGIKNSFVRFGVYGQYYLGGWHKLIFSQDNYKKVQKTSFTTIRLSGLAQADYGITINLRIKNIYLFYDYGISPTFYINNTSVRQNTCGIYYFLSLNSLHKKKQTFTTVKL